MKLSEESIRGLGAHPNKRGLGISKSMLAIREFAHFLCAHAILNVFKKEVKK